MNNETNTMEECSSYLGHLNCNDTTLQACVDEELRWACLKVLALCNEQAPAALMGSPRQMLLYLSNTYEGVHAPRFELLCRGLYLMSEGCFHQALKELTPVLAGRVEPEFELFREVALHAHTFCLQQLDYDEEALDEFTSLLVQKFAETREHGEADHIARLLGLSQMNRGERRFAALEC